MRRVGVLPRRLLSPINVKDVSLADRRRYLTNENNVWNKVIANPKEFGTYSSRAITVLFRDPIPKTVADRPLSGGRGRWEGGYFDSRPLAPLAEMFTPLLRSV